MSKNKKPPSADESENDLVKQITEEMLPGPALSPNDPAAALAAIDAWNDEWLAIVESQTPKKYALSKVLEEFIERTNYLARWCETLGLDSSALLQFAHDSNETYFAFRPTLPPVPSAVRILLDRLKFRLQPIEAQSPDHSTADAKNDPIPNDEANIKVRKYLEQHPTATTREIAKAVGIAHGRVTLMPAWKAEKVRRETNKVHTPKPARRLTKRMLNAVETGKDPAAIAEAREAAWEQILEKAGPQEMAKLKAMTPKEKAKLVQTALEQFKDDLDESDECS